MDGRRSLSQEDVEDIDVSSKLLSYDVDAKNRIFLDVNDSICI